MSDHLEDLIAKEANRQGKRMTADSLRHAGIDLAGAVLTDAGLISLPGKGSISPADYVRSQSPEAFSALVDEQPVQPTGHTGLTAKYAAEISATRGKPRLDASRYTGITRQFIEENQGNNR